MNYLVLVVDYELSLNGTKFSFSFAKLLKHLLASMDFYVAVPIRVCPLLQSHAQGVRVAPMYNHPRDSQAI